MVRLTLVVSLLLTALCSTQISVAEDIRDGIVIADVYAEAIDADSGRDGDAPDCASIASFGLSLLLRSNTKDASFAPISAPADSSSNQQAIRAPPSFQA